MKKNKHNFYSDVVKKLMSISSPMLCGSHLCPLSPISQVEHWPQAKRAATYQVKCYTWLLSTPTEFELGSENLTKIADCPIHKVCAGNPASPFLYAR
jgi:hypothetical protein